MDLLGPRNDLIQSGLSFLHLTERCRGRRTSNLFDPRELEALEMLQNDTSLLFGGLLIRHWHHIREDRGGSEYTTTRGRSKVADGGVQVSSPTNRGHQLAKRFPLSVRNLMN